MSVKELCCMRSSSMSYGGEGSGSRIWMISWNHNGTLLASCGEDKAVRIWKRTDASPYLECSTTIDDSHTRAVRCVNFSHCGKYLASASFDASIIIYQQENGDYAEANKLEGHESEVKWVAFSPSDEFLATCSRDKTVWFWQLDEDDDFQVSSILKPHTQDVKSVSWHPKEELLVSCSYDCSIRFYKYDGEDWITQQTIENAHSGTVWSSAFDEAGIRLVTVGDDRIIQIWQRQCPEKSATSDEWISIAKYQIEDTRWPLYTVSWNQINGLIAIGGGDSIIRIYRVEKSSGSDIIVPVTTIEAHDNEVNSVSWNPSDPSILASASDDGSIRLFRLES